MFALYTRFEVLLTMLVHRLAEKKLGIALPQMGLGASRHGQIALYVMVVTYTGEAII
jgi:hypothetical protein